ncbi:hypothetical protein SOVF_024220, partial [Spinacia oleracea]
NLGTTEINRKRLIKIFLVGDNQRKMKSHRRVITACGQSGAVERAFDVLAEIGSEIQPISPDHFTIGF